MKSVIANVQNERQRFLMIVDSSEIQKSKHENGTFFFQIKKLRYIDGFNMLKKYYLLEIIFN